MAQKQFKIGLSNTDKQNMAQDVYERVLALTFAEYDSAETYNEGDFVVYNDLLYKCLADNVTGTWDATKWQQATLQDLLDDVEGAVASVDGKANVDGNYPTMTVGMADNLTPYDESAGDDQDEPFSLQATGTGNGTQSDFSTGSGALLREKQGNTVVVNQQMQESSRIVPSGFYEWSGGSSQFTLINGHKYLIIFDNNELDFRIRNISLSYVGSRLDCETQIIDFSNTTDSTYIFQYDGTSTKNTSVTLIDLTQWFNGDIPQDLLDHPENFFRYYQGSLAYNEGALVNADGRYIKCIGMNQWDEQAELGGIDGATEQNTSSSTTLRSKNYISVIPNRTYYFKSTYYMNVRWYDANKNYLGYTVVAKNTTFVIPSNVGFMRFVLPQEYGTTYNNDISINLYYEDEPRCLTYEPYQVLTNNDTGTEVLRSAGSGENKKKDYKTPDGTIHRLVGNRAYQSDDENDSSLTTDGTTTNYPLDEPTTEQGTSYSENLVIDDFGSMDFGGTNGVPQGALIFYPVDYKAFVDTLYNYTEGTPSNIALKTDLPTAPQTWAESLPGYDATKTQTLKNVEGTLTWVDD